MAGLGSIPLSALGGGEGRGEVGEPPRSETWRHPPHPPGATAPNPSLSPRKRAERGKGVHYRPRSSCLCGGTEERPEHHFEAGHRRDMNIEPFDHDKALLNRYGLQQFDETRRFEAAADLG